MAQSKMITDYIKEGIESFKTMKQDKAAYKKNQERVKTLPDDYQKVYKALSQYIWERSDPSGQNALKVLEGVLALFEEGASRGKTVREIVGPNLGEFAEALSDEIDHSWINVGKEKLNKQFGDI